jgi:TolB protein
MDSDGSHRSVLFGDRDHSALAPVWSPHGESIAFSIGRFFQAQLGTAIADIAVIRSDGAGLRRLTDGSGN